MFDRIVRHGNLVTVTVLIVCVLGVLAALRIPVQMIPDLEVRTITISIAWPGATPQDIEKEILIEQEEYLRNLPHLKTLTSSADTGTAEIELEFPFGVDINEMLIRVSNALTQVPSYPENVDEPSISASSFSDNAFIFFYVRPLDGNPRQLNMMMMRDYIEDNVRSRLSTVAGVSDIRLVGGAERQIHIRLQPERLAAQGLTLAEVRSAIRERNRDVSGGELESGKRRYLIRTVGRFETLSDMEELIISQRGDSITRLGDVAEIHLDHSKIRDRGIVNGEEVISLMVHRESGSNVIQIKEGLLAEQARINEELLHPAGMSLELSFDDVVYVQESIANVWQNLILGALLATALMFAFLRSFKTTFIGVIGIPICTIGAFLGLLLAGRTVNVISLAGVAFAIGLTLDNSIVVLENIELERRKGLSRVRAAVAGVRGVWPAVLASTLTTVMVFLPVVFIQEEAGQLYSDVAIAISTAILLSMLIAITVVPTACAQFGVSVTEQRSRRGLLLRQKVIDGIDWLIATPGRRLGCLIVTVAISGSIVLLLTPPAEYLPEGEEPKVFASMNAPPGYNLATMDEVADEILDFLMPLLDHSPEQFSRGETDAPALRYFNLRLTPQTLRVVTEPKNPAHIEPLTEAILEQYRRYPGMRTFASRGSIISSNDGGTRSVNLDISGPDLASLYRVGQLAYYRAQTLFDNPRIQTQPSSLALAQPMIEIRPDWERASEVGLSTDELGFTVAALTNGAYVSEFFMADRKIDMYLYNRDGPVADLNTLAQIEVFTPNGHTLPLSQLARAEETVDTGTVRRKDGQRTVTLNIIPPRNVPLETGVEIVRRDLVQYLQEQGQVPGDVTVRISGAADQLDATRQSLTSNFIVALVIVFLMLVAIFNHWGYPLLIMTSIPLGVAGGIAGLALMNLTGDIKAWLGFADLQQPFDMISMLGFLILMGVVINNPILLVHRSITNVTERAMDAVSAVREAVESRLRPMAISTLTTVGGLIPLVFIPGAGTELYRGVGVIVMSGLIGATIVTLTLLPCLTVSVLQWRHRLRDRWPLHSEP